jgi:hypothetical protein
MMEDLVMDMSDNKAKTKRKIAMALAAVLFFLILVGFGVCVYVLYDATNSKYHICDKKVCHNACMELGGFAGRVMNMESHKWDGWIDCKCVGTVRWIYIPIKLDEVEVRCKL